MHLVHHALFYALASGGAVRAAGRGVPPQAISSHFKNYLNDHPGCHLEIRYSAELAPLACAGADLLVPSMFEPCGLAPLIGMRYGTVLVFGRDCSALAGRAQRVCVSPG